MVNNLVIYLWQQNSYGSKLTQVPILLNKPLEIKTMTQPVPHSHNIVRVVKIQIQEIFMLN